VDDVLKDITGGGQAQPTTAGNPLGDLLGGLMGGGGLGSILGAGAGLGSGSATGNTAAAGGLAALIPTLLPAILGMLGGNAAGGQTGLHQLVDSMQANGLGDVAQSWVGNAGKQPITAAQVEQVLNSSQLAELAAKSGIPADQVSAGVASILPHIVSSLTPDGKLPEPAQVQSAVGQLQQVLAGLTGGRA